MAPCAGSGRQRRATGARVRALQNELVRSGVISDVETMIEDQVATAFRALDDPAIDPAAAEGLAAARRVAWRTT